MPHTLTQTLSQLTIQDMIHARIVSLFLLLSATAEVKAFILRAHQKARKAQEKQSKKNYKNPKDTSSSSRKT